jgi:hypothetical protein
MAKKIQFRITIDGTLRAETFGIKGPSCTTLVRLLERLTDARAADSAFTAEYFEQAVEEVGKQANSQIEERNHGQ